ncbi:hypothetical protein HPB47_014491 [Ixodes persulcatus]|uniref:Uncharacterized protein n=1 Tax=Ixodes persulcatus TaxID=34615 RepID=A0AC60QVU9_IXOPE|nr:hypothetical protein HPB47_014491 [Ixodes persulcatus]
MDVFRLPRLRWHHCPPRLTGDTAAKDVWPTECVTRVAESGPFYFFQHDRYSPVEKVPVTGVRVSLGSKMVSGTLTVLELAGPNLYGRDLLRDFYLLPTPAFVN